MGRPQSALQNRSKRDLNRHLKGLMQSYVDKLEYLRQWRKRNPDKVREYSLRWRASNPERSREIEVNYRNRNRKSLNHRSKECQSRRRKVIQHGVDVSNLYLETFCHWCAELLLSNKIEIDHVVPLSRGGRHTEDNLVASCRSCNRSKKDKFYWEWDGELAA